MVKHVVFGSALKTPFFLKRWEYKWFSCVSGQFFYWHFLCLNKKWEVLKKLSDNTYFSWLLQAWIETTKKDFKNSIHFKTCQITLHEKMQFSNETSKERRRNKSLFLHLKYTKIGFVTVRVSKVRKVNNSKSHKISRSSTLKNLFSISRTMRFNIFLDFSFFKSFY